MYTYDNMCVHPTQAQALTRLSLTHSEKQKLLDLLVVDGWLDRLSSGFYRLGVWAAWVCMVVHRLFIQPRITPGSYFYGAGTHVA